MLIYSYL